MRVLVCGGRDYTDRDAVYRALDQWLEGDYAMEVICGYDPDDERYQGADQIAFEWAMERRIPVFPFPAPWRKHGRSAGPRRNSRQLDCGKPQRFMAFPGGPGTADMTRKAKAAGVKEIERLNA